MIKNLPANAGNTGLILDPGRFHMPQSNSAREPQLLKPECLEPMLCNERSHHNEKPVHCNKDPAWTKINYSFLKSKRNLEVKTIAGSQAA